MPDITILAPIGLGELIDKITILDIKLENVQDSVQKQNILIERKELGDILNQFEFAKDSQLVELTEKLININKKMWWLEDTVRDCIDANDYGDVYIQVAKDIPITNDLRCVVKKEINLKFNSIIVEEKLYQTRKNNATTNKT